MARPFALAAAVLAMRPADGRRSELQGHEARALPCATAFLDESEAVARGQRAEFPVAKAVLPFVAAAGSRAPHQGAQPALSSQTAPQLSGWVSRAAPVARFTTRSDVSEDLDDDDDDDIGETTRPYSDTSRYVRLGKRRPAEPSSVPSSRGESAGVEGTSRAGFSRRRYFAPLGDKRGGADGGEDDMPPSDSGLLAKVKASGILQGEWAMHDIVLPQSWAEKFVPDSIVTLEQENSLYVGRARLSEVPIVQVAFAARKAGVPATMRDIAVSRLLSGSGAVPALFATQSVLDTTYTLTESPGGQTLDMVLYSKIVGTARPQELLMPPEESLPIIIDLLRGLQAMEENAIVHSDLTEDKIFIVDSGRHALITDFSEACLVDSSDLFLGCSRGDAAGSAYRHAPEMEAGRADRVSVNVWQLGLVFARMTLGDVVPTLSEVLRWAPAESAVELDDTTWRGRQLIRELIAKYFAIEEVPAFKRLYPEHQDILDIVKGMLERNPDNRWSASGALVAAEKVAHRRGVSLPAMRQPMEVPPDLVQDWQ